MLFDLCLLLILHLNVCVFYLIFIKKPMSYIMRLVYFYALISLLLILYGFKHYSMLVVLFLYVAAILLNFLFICKILHAFEVEYNYKFKNTTSNKTFLVLLWEHRTLFLCTSINNLLCFLTDEDLDSIILYNHEFIHFICLNYKNFTMLH